MAKREPIVQETPSGATAADLEKLSWEACILKEKLGLAHSLAAVIARVEGDTPLTIIKDAARQLARLIYEGADDADLLREALEEAANVH